jgi:hypothetical protein
MKRVLLIPTLRAKPGFRTGAANDKLPFLALAVAFCWIRYELFRFKTAWFNSLLGYRLPDIT